MALITCPECGKEISDKAKSCINCGYPIHEHVPENDVIEKTLDERQIKKQPRDPDVQELADFILNSDYWEQEKNTEQFLSDLYRCAYLESRTNKYYDNPNCHYALYLFAIWDACLSKKYSYDSFAGKDWIRKHSKEISNDYSHEGITSDDVLNTYIDYRYGQIANRILEIEEKSARNNESNNICSSIMSVCVDDMIQWLFTYPKKIVEGKVDADDEAKSHAQTFIMGLKFTVFNNYKVFSKVHLIDDYKRDNPPAIESYNLPENIEVLYKKAVQEADRHFALKKIAAKSIPVAIIFLSIYLSITKGDWIWLCIDVLPVIWAIFAGQYTEHQKWKYIDDKGGCYMEYHKYLQDCKDYEEWYSDKKPS